MKVIRFLILVAIIALVALAFIKRTSENPGQQDAVEAFMQPILEIQGKVEKNFPQLREDLEKLKNGVRDRIANIDPKSLIPLHLPSSSSALPADLQAPPEEAGKDETKNSPLENAEIAKQVQDLAGNLKNMSAEELKKRVKEMYEKLQQYTQTPETEKTPEGK